MAEYSTIKLVGLDRQFDIVAVSKNVDRYILDEYDEDSFIIEKVAKYVYKDFDDNTLIVIGRSDEDDKYVSPIDVIDRIRPDAFDYLIKEIENSSGVTFVVSAIPFTTSDFTIIYDDVDYKEVSDYLDSCDRDSYYKFNEVFPDKHIRKIEEI